MVTSKDENQRHSDHEQIMAGKGEELCASGNSDTRQNSQRLARQDVILSFGTFALRCENLDELLQCAAERIAQAIGLNYAKILEYRPEHDDLLIRAGVGWKPGVIGQVALPANLLSPTGRAYRTGQTVIINDLRDHSQFSYPDFLREHNIVALANVPVRIDGNMYGVLEVDADIPISFSEQDINFIEQFALLLGSGVMRLKAEEERNHLLVKLQKERALTEAIINQLPLGLAIIDAQFESVLNYNQKAIELLKHPIPTTVNSLVGKQYGALHDGGKSYTPDEYPVIRALRLGEFVADEEMIYRRGDGQTAIFLTNAAPVRDKDGKIISAVCTFQDISHQKQLEHDLRENEQHFRFMAETIPEIVWSATPEGYIDYCNSRWAKFTGLPLDMPYNEQWRASLHPDDVEHSLTAWNAARIAGTSYESEHRIRKVDGTYQWILCRAEPLRNDKSEIVRWFGTAANIDTEKRAQEALTEAKEQAERANRSKSSFLASASHDLRQPLNAMSLLIGILRQRLTDPSLARISQQVEESLTAMMELFEALLDLSKLESGAVNLKIEPVELGPLLQRIAIEFRTVAEAKGLECCIVPTRSVGVTDASLLERILRNLVSNAIRYTDRGRILIGVRRRKDKIRIDVFDTGRGIAEQDIHKIFQEFQQVGNSARERSDGHGLGLAIVKRAADLLEHPITVSSKLGKGSRFSIEIPKASASKEASRNRRRKSSFSSRAYLSVMLIEDDPLVQTATRMVLEDLGCGVMEARTANEAQSMLHKSSKQPDLIISDFRLPGGIDGVSAIQDLRNAFGARIPAVVITGDVARDVRSIAEQAKVGFMQKPIRASDLRGLVQKVSARHDTDS